MPVADEEPMDTPTGEIPADDTTADEAPFEKEPFDAGVEADEEEDPKKFIQQLTGKLGQSLRQYTDEQGQPDFELEKFAINSLLSATHTGEMDSEDQKDIIKKVKKSGKNDENDSESNTGDNSNDDIDDDSDIDSDENIDTENDEETVDESEENFLLKNPKKLSIFAPKGSNEYNPSNDYEKDNHDDVNESNNYMFWSNLKTICHAVEEILLMDYDKVDSILSDGHGWALDHIATSADDVEEVYHFLDSGINDDYSEWSKPMQLTKSIDVSPDLKYHLDNGMALGESVFRYGSDKFFNLVKEVKTLYKKNLIALNENDSFIVNDFDNMYVEYNGQKLKMNFIFENVNQDEQLNEAEYKGKKVQLNKPKRGGSKKFYVYVKDPKSGNIKKVSFGAKSGGGNLAVKLKDPKARKRFADRHNCKQKNDKTTPGYWSCRLPRYAKLLGLSGGGTFW
jgi:hypothetical protein